MQGRLKTRYDKWKQGEADCKRLLVKQYQGMQIRAKEKGK